MDDFTLKTLAAAQLAWAIQTRRAFHRIPEPGFREEKTRALIREKLTEIGVPYQDENGWITALVEGAKSGPVTALRADFDALPVTEPMGCPFRSEHEGYMHACGHDMHTAIMLATARLLTGIRGEMAGSAKLLFQPAEETVGGAKPMAEAGVMDNPKVDRVYGLHVMPYLVTGQVESRPGTLNASTDTVTIEIVGRSSHGAYPDRGEDAILCACQVVTALQSIVARNVSPLESAVLTIGKIEGGRASNILCDRVTLTGTLRTANRELRDKMLARIRSIARGVSEGMGQTANVSLSEGYAALVNDESHAERVLSAARRLLGAENVFVKAAPSMGGEDFSYFLEKAPGAFFHLGCSPDRDHLTAPLHSEEFCPDERCMEYGVLMEAALVLGE